MKIIEDLIKSGDIGTYQECLFDSFCGEPVRWWYPILKRLWEQKWGELSKLGEMRCCYPNWYLITKSLTRQEAIEKYGEQKDVEFWPRGGFRSVTFWEKKFCMRELNKV